MTSALIPLVRELDRRIDGGADVRLLWDAHGGHVWVEVLDASTGDTFRLAVRDGVHALEAFRFPFAYAALCGVDTSGVDPAPVVAALCAT